MHTSPPPPCGGGRVGGRARSAPRLAPHTIGATRSPALSKLRQPPPPFLPRKGGGAEHTRGALLSRPWLRPSRRRRRERVLGPVVLGIAAAHLGAHGAIARCPEPGEIAGHLQRTPRRRQQKQPHRHLAAGDARRR